MNQERDHHQTSASMHARYVTRYSHTDRYKRIWDPKVLCVGLKLATHTGDKFVSLRFCIPCEECAQPVSRDGQSDTHPRTHKSASTLVGRAVEVRASLDMGRARGAGRAGEVHAAHGQLRHAQLRLRRARRRRRRLSQG